MPSAVKCPGCAGEVEIPDELHGTAVVCPRCDQRFTAPDEAPPPPPTVRPAPQPSIDPAARKFCHQCGASIVRSARVCPGCNATQPDAVTRLVSEPVLPLEGFNRPPRIETSGTNRVLCGVLAIFLGMFGVHKFVMGYAFEGLVMLMVTIFGTPCAAAPPFVMLGIGIIEGIIYLSKNDAEFHQLYEVGHKGWF